MKSLSTLTFLLVVIGAINWTLFGLFGVNLITSIFGGVEILVKLVYFLIGMSGVSMLLTHYTGKKIV